MLLMSANFRPRVQTAKGSLAGLGIIGNGVVFAILPLCLIALLLVLPVILAATLFAKRPRHSKPAPSRRGALASR